MNIIKTKDGWYIGIADGDMRGPFAEEPKLAKPEDTTIEVGAPVDAEIEKTYQAGGKAVTIHQKFEDGSLRKEEFVKSSKG